MARHNAIRNGRVDLTLSAVVGTKRNARACGHPLPETARRDARYCSPACRQAAYRERHGATPRGRRAPALVVVDGTGRLGAGHVAENQESDPPTPGFPPPLESEPTGARAVPAVPADHAHNGRLCAACMSARHAELRRAPRARRSAEPIAATIRRDRGQVWGAVREYGITYEHALRIRRGWRGAGRTAPAIRYRSRGWTEAGPNGGGRRWRELQLAELRGRVLVAGVDPIEQIEQLEVVG